MVVKINIKEMTAEIDLSKNRIFIVKDGMVEYEDAPKNGFGEHIISWQHGKVNYIKETSTRKI